MNAGFIEPGVTSVDLIIGFAYRTCILKFEYTLTTKNIMRIFIEYQFSGNTNHYELLPELYNRPSRTPGVTKMSRYVNKTRIPVDLDNEYPGPESLDCYMIPMIPGYEFVMNECDRHDPVTNIKTGLYTITHPDIDRLIDLYLLYDFNFHILAEDPVFKNYLTLAEHTFVKHWLTPVASTQLTPYEYKNINIINELQLLSGWVDDREYSGQDPDRYVLINDLYGYFEGAVPVNKLVSTDNVSLLPVIHYTEVSELAKRHSVIDIPALHAGIYLSPMLFTTFKYLPGPVQMKIFLITGLTRDMNHRAYGLMGDLRGTIGLIYEQEKETRDINKCLKYMLKISYSREFEMYEHLRQTSKSETNPESYSDVFIKYSDAGIVLNQIPYAHRYFIGTPDKHEYVANLRTDFADRIRDYSEGLLTGIDYTNISVVGSIIPYATIIMDYAIPVESELFIHDPRNRAKYIDGQEELAVEYRAHIKKINDDWFANRRDVDIMITTPVLGFEFDGPNAKKNDKHRVVFDMKHFEARVDRLLADVRRNDPGAALHLVPVADNRVKYYIRSPNKKIELEIFPVRHPAEQILSFHLAPVRAWYDGRDLHMAPSFIQSALTGCIIDGARYTFATTTLSAVIKKYTNRGFTFVTKYGTREDLMKLQPDIDRSRLVLLTRGDRITNPGMLLFALSGLGRPHKSLPGDNRIF